MEQENLTQEVEEMDSTSINKLIFATILTLLFVGFTSSFYYNSDRSSSFSDDSYVQIPEVDNQFELGTQIVAPFLLITLILQIGFQRVLQFTLDEDKSKWASRDPKYKKERAKIRKQSTIMALLVAGMIVPTQTFQLVRSWVSIVYGSVAIIFFTVMLLGFTYLIYKGWR